MGRKEFNNTAVKIISAERDFWNDYRFPHYLVSLIPIGTICDSRGGTGLNHSFSAFMGSDCLLDDELIFLIAHENFHTWNKPSIFKLMNSQNEKHYYWFSEGFTNYYANLFDLRIGLINLEDYIKKYNKMLVDYYSSPALSSTVTIVQNNFWNNHDVQLIPYQQGEILAHNWNAKIKQATLNKKSLDDLMKALINPIEPSESQLTVQKIDAISKKFSIDGIINDINHVNHGDLIIPDKKSLGPCVYQINKMMAPYKFGVDVDTSKRTGVITSVKLTSKAFHAGLRDGQKLISIRNNSDDINQMIVVTIKEKGVIKVIRYLPYVGNLKSIPQFELNKEMWKMQPDKCIAWFKT